MHCCSSTRMALFACAEAARFHTHNHAIGKNVFNTYAETRKITSPATRSVLGQFGKVEPREKRILRYLKDVSGKPIQTQDVNNMIAEMRRESYTSPDANIRVTELLQDFSEGPGNVVRVYRDTDSQLTSCIAFQTSHMRRMARLFPEVVCIDATHGTNINRYRLFSFMVTDKFGCGAFAQHSLIDGETEQNMKMLPCRHIIFLRLQQSKSTAIPCENIPPRWCLLEEDEDADLRPVEVSSFAIADVPGVKSSKVISHNAKYKNALAVCQRIAEVVADKGTTDYSRWLSHLECLERNARDNGNPVPVGADDNCGESNMINDSDLALHEPITLSEIEDEFSGLQLMHAVRGVLPVALVNKCITAIENVILREKANNGRDVSHDDVAVVILKVGTFRANDIAIMQQWHSMASVVRGAKALVSWIKSVKFENPDEEEERNAIVETVLELDLRGSVNSGGVSVEFAELARFGNDGWLSDQCLMGATQRIAAEASCNPPPNIHVINPTFSHFEDDDQRNRLLDTKSQLFSKCHDGLAMLCSIYINIDYGHWCGVIIDIKRRVIWIYDPFHRKKHEDEVKRKVVKVFLELVDPAYKLEIREFRAWPQQDGFSCGVYVAHWFDYYVSTYILSPDKIVSTDTEPLSEKELERIRYKIFCYVLFGMQIKNTSK